MLVSWNRSFYKVGRDAARRRKETDLLSDLAKSLPLPEKEVDYVTQNNALNLAVQYIRLRKMVKSVPGQKYVKSEDLWLNDIFKHGTKFLLVVEKSGTIMYASERITQILGQLQVSVIGAHFSELMNVEYHDDFSLLLTDKTIWSRLIGMKYRSLSRGKPKSKVMHVSVLRRCDEHEFPFVVLECEPFERVPILELVIGASMEFTINAYTRIILDTDWKFEILSGFSRKQFIGTNMMQYVYPTDVVSPRDMNMRVIQSVINNGVCNLLPFRVISGHGVWYWTTMEIKPSKVKNGKVTEMKCRFVLLRPYIPEEEVYYLGDSTGPAPATSTQEDITLPPQSTSDVSMYYSRLPALSDLPTSNPPSVCSSSVCSSGEVSYSTEPLSDLSVEDVLGPPNDTSTISGSHFQHIQSDQLLSNPLPSLPSESNVTDDIIELLLH